MLELKKHFAKIGLVLIVFIAGYLLGQFIPFAYFNPTLVTPFELSNFQIAQIRVTIFSGSITLLAIVLALLKEDIRKYWDKGVIFIEPKEKKEVHYLKEEIKVGLSEVEELAYVLPVYVTNNGTLTAKNCEIYLESLFFTKRGLNDSHEIEVKGDSINWSSNKSEITLPPKRRIKIDLLELRKNETKGDSTAVQNQTASLIIGGIDASKEKSDGTWVALYVVCSENCKKHKFQITVTWTGEWKPTLTSIIKGCIEIDCKSI